VMSNETGLMECPIRLPCSGVIGADGLAKWLRTNNTCPISRPEVF